MVSPIDQELIVRDLGILLRLREDDTPLRFALQSPSYAAQAVVLAYFAEECLRRNQRILLLVPSQRHVLCEKLKEWLERSRHSNSRVFSFFEGKKWPHGRVVLTTWEKGFNLLQRRSRNQFSAVALIGLDEMLSAQNRSYLADVLLFLLVRKKRIVRALSIYWTSPYWNDLLRLVSHLDPSLSILDQWASRSSNESLRVFPELSPMVLRKEVHRLRQAGMIRLEPLRRHRESTRVQGREIATQALRSNQWQPEGVCIVTNRSREDFPPSQTLSFRTFTEDLSPTVRIAVLDIASLIDHRKAILSSLARYFPLPGVQIVLLVDAFWQKRLTDRSSKNKLGFWWNEIFEPRPFAQGEIDHLTVLRLFSQQRTTSFLDEYVEQSCLVARSPLFHPAISEPEEQKIAGFRSQPTYHRALRAAFAELQAANLLQGGYKVRTSPLGQLIMRYNLPFQAYRTLAWHIEGVKQPHGLPLDKVEQAEFFATLYHTFASQVIKDQQGEILQYGDFLHAFQQILGVVCAPTNPDPHSYSQISRMITPAILQAVFQHILSSADLTLQSLADSVETILTRLKGLQAKLLHNNPDKTQLTRYAGNPAGTQEQLITALLQFATTESNIAGEPTQAPLFLKVQDLIARLDVPRRTAHNYLYRIFNRRALTDGLAFFGIHREKVLRIRLLLEMETWPLGRGRPALVIFRQEKSHLEICGNCTARVPSLGLCSWLQRLNAADSERMPLDLKQRLESVPARMPRCRLFAPRTGAFYVRELNYHIGDLFGRQEPLCPRCKEHLRREPKPQQPVACRSCGSVLSSIQKGPFRNYIKVELSEEALLQAYAEELGFGRLPRPHPADSDNLHLYIDAHWKTRIVGNELLLTHNDQTWAYPLETLATVYTEGKPTLITQLRRRGVPRCHSRSIRGIRRKTAPRLQETLHYGYPAAILAVPYVIRLLSSIMTTTRELYRIIPKSPAVQVTKTACQQAYEQQGRYIARQLAHGILPMRNELQYFETWVRRPLVTMCRAVLHYVWDDRRMINPRRGRQKCRRVAAPFTGVQDFHRAWTMTDTALNTVNHLQRTVLRETLAQVGYGWNPGRLFNHEPRDKPGKGALLDLEEEPRLLVEVQLTRALGQKRFGPSHFHQRFIPQGLPYYYPNDKGFQALWRFVHQEFLPQPVQMAFDCPLSFRQLSLADACRQYAIVTRQRLNALARHPCYRIIRQGGITVSAEQLAIVGAGYLGRYPELAVPFIPDRLWGPAAWERTLHDLPHFWCDLPQQLLNPDWLGDSACAHVLQFIRMLRQSLATLKTQIIGGTTAERLQETVSVSTPMDDY